MTDSALLDHPTTAAALRLAQRWCAGHRIGAKDALDHALLVVGVLHHHIRDVAPEVTAAVLLHDSPDLVPATLDLDVLLAMISPEVARLVRALQHEHDGLDTGARPAPPVHDLPLMQASGADKIVSIQGVLDRAGAATEPAAYWTQRRGFITALPYFRTFHHAAKGVLPRKMVGQLGALVTQAERHITTHGPGDSKAMTPDDHPPLEGSR